MTFRTNHWIAFLLFAVGMPALAGPLPQTDAATKAAIEAAINGEHRPDRWRARDQYRHPLETLTFFGLRQDMTVVELWPGTGWYTDILAPVLREQGKFYAAGFGLEATPAFRSELEQTFRDQLAERPALFDQVSVTVLDPPQKTAIARPGSADMVLTFRNSHNWTKAGVLDDVNKAAFEALKPGGIFGVVQHRATEAMGQSEDVQGGKVGYLPESFVIAAALRAGFELVAKSEVNANPKDTKDYPKGVWTLPPSLRLGDENRDQYLAIGESDRMTLKFRKPE